MFLERRDRSGSGEPSHGVASKTRHSHLPLALLALALLFAPGCLRRVPDGALGAPATKLTFAFWALAPAEATLYHSLVAEFAATHPTCQVEVLEIPNRYYQKLQVLFAAGTPPDVMVVNYGRLGDLARRGLLAEVSSGREAAHFAPPAAAALRSLSAAQGKAGWLGLPLDWPPANLLVYDREAFAAAGAKPPGPGWTWTDWAAACRQLTVRSPDPNSRRYGSAVCLYPYAALSWLLQGGGAVLAEGGRSVLASPANVQTLRFLQGLAREGVIAPLVPGEDRSLEDFRAGRVAMAFVTPYVLGDLRQHPAGRQWALAAPLTGARRLTGCIPTAVAVAGASHAPEAARELALFLATHGAEARAAAGLAVPAWQPALDSPALVKGFGPEAAAVLRQALPLARPYPLSQAHSYEELSGALREALEEIFGGGATPERALGETDRRLNGGERANRDGEGSPRSDCTTMCGRKTGVRLPFAAAPGCLPAQERSKPSPGHDPRPDDLPRTSG